MSGPVEPTGLCVNHGVTEASGKVGHARHNIIKVVKKAPANAEALILMFSQAVVLDPGSLTRCRAAGVTLH
jgi:hypothetical protein